MSENLDKFADRIRDLEAELDTDFRVLMEIRRVYKRSRYDIEVVEPATHRTLVKSSGKTLDEALWYAQERLNTNVLQWDRVGVVQSRIDNRSFDVV